jgi:hypothetical protein
VVVEHVSGGQYLKIRGIWSYIRVTESTTYFWSATYKRMVSEDTTNTVLYLSLAKMVSCISISTIYRARNCKPFKETRNRFPAWRNRFLIIYSWTPYTFKIRAQSMEGDGVMTILRGVRYLLSCTTLLCQKLKNCRLVSF